MNRTKSQSRGFTLIASLLLLALMSCMAIGLFMMVTTEGKAGGNDLQNTMAFRDAEGGIEKMTADMANTTTAILNPQVSDITGLSANNPNPAMYVQYTLTPATKNNDGVTPLTHWTQIPSGTFAGLNAQSWDVALVSTAQTPLNDQVSMTRTVQIDMVPVFQFGAFSETDLSYYNNPSFEFGGRVHTNGDLYLNAASGADVYFHNKMEAYGNVIREVWPNGYSVAAYGANGNIHIPTASAGCDLPARSACLIMNPAWESEVGYPSWSQNASPTFKSTSQTTYNGWIIDGDNGSTTYGTGAQLLNLPFITGSNITANNAAAYQHQMLAVPAAGASATAPLGASQLYNQAQIRILLADNPSEFIDNPTNSDGQTIRLANVNNGGSAPDYTYGVPVSVPTTMPALAAGHSYNMYFATSSTGIADPSTCGATSCDNLKIGSPVTWGPPADWPYTPAYPPNVSMLTLVPNSGSVAANANPPNAPVLSYGTAVTTTTSAPAIAAGPPPNCNTSTGVCPYPYFPTPDFPPNYYNGGASAPTPETNASWNLLDGYLRIEALENGVWVGVTTEWLQLGFGRGPAIPNAAGANPVSPNAILILQEAADRNYDGAVNTLGVAPVCTKVGATYTCTKSGVPPEAPYDQIKPGNCTPAALCGLLGDGYYASQVTGNLKPGTPSITMFNWYPINFYDSREGENWDVRNAAATTCAVNGVMNAVELDVGNLKQWLLGTIGSTGTTISTSAQNGYLVYFSDRRGMLPATNGPNAGTITGEYGFEDTINLANSGVPNGTLEPTPPGKTYSPEDVDEDGVLETYGAANTGLGFGISASAPTKTVNSQVNLSAVLNPYTRFSCSYARSSWISGARHVLRLLDGANTATTTQLPLPGFTVGSENPVYVMGPYNSYNGDTVWNTPSVDSLHSNASIIADAVTLLSPAWTDKNSFALPEDSIGKSATSSSYRLAIAGGKTVNFTNTAGNPQASFGTDGGMGNFLRLLEDWCSNGGCSPQQQLNYSGSLVSLYYSEYATGTFKCCDDVYNPPIRNFNFDTDFTVPSGLPPATPMFRDIDNLTYRQFFTQRANSD